MVPLLQQLFSISLSSLGILIGGGLIISACTVPLWGRVASRLGYRRTLQLTTVGSLCGLVLMIIAIWLQQHNVLGLSELYFAFLVAARSVYCLFSAALLPLIQSYKASSAAKGKVLSKVAASSSLQAAGRLIANGLGGFMLSYSILMPLLSILPLFILSLFRIPPTSVHAPKGEATSFKVLLQPLVVTLTLQMVIGGTYVLLGPWLGERFDLSAEAAASTTALCLFWATLTTLLSQLALTLLLGTRKKIAMLLGLTLVSISLAALPFASSIVQVVLITCLLSSGTALTLSSNLALTLEGAGQQRSPTVTTTLFSAQLVGLGVGSIVFARLGELGISTSFHVASLFTFILVAALVLFRGLSQFQLKSQPFQKDS